MHHCAVLHLNFSRYRISANEPLNVSATALEKKYSYYQQIAQLLSLVSYLLSPVICPSPPVPRLLSHVSCLTSPVSRLLPSPFVPCFLSLASCPTSSFTLVLSHMSCLTSPVSCLQSHVSCLQSHVTCHLSHVSCLFFFDFIVLTGKFRKLFFWRFFFIYAVFLTSKRTKSLWTNEHY